MSSTKNRTELSLEVQENIILSIKQLYPNSFTKDVIRSILVQEGWDLEKSLQILHESSLNQVAGGKSNKKNKSSNQSNNHQSPGRAEKQQSKSGKEAKNEGGIGKKADLFKRGPGGRETPEAGGWVVVDRPMQPQQSQKQKLKQSYDIIRHFGKPTHRVSAYVKEGIKVMVLLRGVSGSGKTTYANQLLEKEGAKYPKNHIFSTDSYFIGSNGAYYFQFELLQEAHEWNQKLVQTAAAEGRSPIFVDNTNTRLWEMKEYAVTAVKYGYVLETLEPPTPWFFNEDILFRKTNHATPKETIRKMLDRYEANLSGEDVIRNLHLVYAPQLSPPQRVQAGLEVPMSKKHKKMLDIPLIKWSNVSASNNGIKVKKTQDLNPKIPELGSWREGLEKASNISDAASRNRFMKVPELSNRLQNCFVSPPDTSVNKNPNSPRSPVVCHFGILSPGAASIHSSGLSLRNYEYFPPKPKKNMNNLVVSPNLDGSLQNFPPSSGKLINYSNSNTDSEGEGEGSGKSGSSPIRSDGQPEREGKYGTALSFGNNETTLEYVFVPANNLISFQKHHIETEGITSLEEFKKSGSDSTANLSRLADCWMGTVETSADRNYVKQFSEEVASQAPSHSQSVEFSSHAEPDKTEELLQNQTTSQLVLNLTSSVNALDICSAESQTVTENTDSETLEEVNAREHSAVIVESPEYPLKSEFVSCQGSSPSENACEKPAENSPIDTLNILFPEISREKLIEIFGPDKIDLYWAIDLLLGCGQKMIANEDIESVIGGNSSVETEKKENPTEVGTEEPKSMPANYSDTIPVEGDMGPISSNPLSDEMSRAFSEFLQENEGSSSCSSIDEPISNQEYGLSIGSNRGASNICISNRTNASFGAIPKNKNYIGDWDYSNDVPKVLPADVPKLQRNRAPRVTNKFTTGTNTNYADFEIVRNINSDKGCTYQGLTVLIGNPCFVSAVAPSSHPCSILMLEKGTMTSDIKTNQIQKLDSGLDLLASLFPQVSRDNLEEIFEKCQRDIDWSVGILMDSGQELSELYTSLDAVVIPDPEKDEPETMNGDGEKDPTELSDQAKSSSENKKKKKKKKIKQSNKDNESHEDLQKQLESNFVLNEDYYSSERMKNYFQKRTQRKVDFSESEETNNSVVIPGDNENNNEDMSDNSCIEEEIVFMLDSDFILQLQSRFGGLLRPNMLGERTVVSLPLSLARQLHSYVMDSVQDHIQDENAFTDEDEEYARHLQEEENRARGAPSLLEIMDEEVALRKSQKECTSGRSMASALSKQLLLERFPKMDPSSLASILDDTNHSLHQATFVLSSAGHSVQEPQPLQEKEEDEEKTALSREEAIKQADAYGDIASQLYELRKSCLTKSQKSYRDGNHSVAVYYADMAKWYMEWIEKSNSMAAKAILSGHEGMTTLDLHFLQVGEALNVLELFVDEAIRKLQKTNQRIRVVYVITGRGNHSVGGRPRLKPAAQAWLIRRRLKFVEQNPGMLKITIPRTAPTTYELLAEENN